MANDDYQTLYHDPDFNTCVQASTEFAETILEMLDLRDKTLQTLELRKDNIQKMKGTRDTAFLFGIIALSVAGFLFVFTALDVFMYDGKDEITYMYSLGSLLFLCFVLALTSLGIMAGIDKKRIPKQLQGAQKAVTDDREKINDTRRMQDELNTALSNLEKHYPDIPQETIWELMCVQNSCTFKFEVIHTDLDQLNSSSLECPEDLPNIITELRQQQDQLLNLRDQENRVSQNFDNVTPAILK